jgi:hypothetical protein
LPLRGGRCESLWWKGLLADVVASISSPCSLRVFLRSGDAEQIAQTAQVENLRVRDNRCCSSAKRGITTYVSRLSPAPSAKSADCRQHSSRKSSKPCNRARAAAAYTARNGIRSRRTDIYASLFKSTPVARSAETTNSNGDLILAS